MASVASRMSQPDRAPSVLRPLLLAACITLAVTALRLVGELQQWSPSLSNRDAGGGGALLGITWLVPVFGLWFGIQLARGGRPPAHKGKAILLPILGIGGLVGAMALQFMVLELDGNAMFAYLGATLGACSLTALAAWPSLFGANLVYGLCARLPIIALTYVAFDKGWDVHHVKLPPNATAAAQADPAWFLSAAQIVLWIPFTILVGGLFGGLGALFVRRPQA